MSRRNVFLSGELRYIDMVHPDDRRPPERNRPRHCNSAHQLLEAEFASPTAKAGNAGSMRAACRATLQGNPLCIDGMLLDVTARRQGRIETYPHRCAAGRRVPLPARKRDGTPNLLYVGRRFGTPVRHQRPRCDGRSVRLFGHIQSDDLPGFLEADQRGIGARYRFPWKSRVLFGTGGERWLYPEFVAAADGRRQIAYVGFVEDITERKQADCLLQESEDRYRRIVETASEASGPWMRASHHLVNQAMTQMLGYSNAEMLGRRIDEFMFDDDLRNHAERLGAGQQGIDQRYERRFRRKDGSDAGV